MACEGGRRLETLDTEKRAGGGGGGATENKQSGRRFWVPTSDPFQTAPINNTRAQKPRRLTLVDADQNPDQERLEG